MESTLEDNEGSSGGSYIPMKRSASTEAIRPPQANEENIAAQQAPQDITELEHYSFSARYGKSIVEVRLAVDDTVADLKAILFSLTDVPPERQKILGIARGKLPEDDALLGEIQYPPSSLRNSPNPLTGEKRITISLVGTPLDQTFKDPEATSEDDVAGAALSDDIDYGDPSETEKITLEPSKDPKALAKLQKAISRFSHTFPVMADPRPNLTGGLLVLDLDYTMADTKKLFNYSQSAHEAERPYLHDFLAAIYPYYDIAVWSQTSHWWLEAKLTEMGCLTDSRYRISFVLDRTPMFSVHSKRKGKDKKHEVKALEIIWRRFPQFYGPHNTCHVDDLSRNFAMNPLCGLQIKPYRNSPSHDTELAALQRYLLQLAHPGVKDFRDLKGHKQWKFCFLPSVETITGDGTEGEANNEDNNSSATNGDSRNE